jgi:hypothetical protein
MQGRRPGWGSLAPLDLIVYAVILCLGALPFFMYEKAPDSLHEDVFYVELAKSLLHDHSYVNNFVTENVQPPGLSIILAGVCASLGCAHDTLVRTMPIFLTLGFLLSYEIIRRQRGRLVAAASCLLLLSSPALFVFVSSVLWPSYPFFFASMLVLLLATNLEKQTSGQRQFLGSVLLAFVLGSALLIQSAGIALIGGLLGWCALAFLGDVSVAKSRLKLIAPAILLALLVQAFWMQRGSNAAQWPLPGYPQGYFSQLTVKNGNHPELGYATPKDVVLRLENNLNEHTRYLIGEVLVQHWISPSWASIAIAGSVILVVIGVGTSLLRDESRLCALYFIGYECIYLLWPWSFETPRFVLPVLPFACLYLAEGGWALWRWRQGYPRRIGAVFLPVCLVLAIFAWREGWGAGAGQGFQEKMSAVFWSVGAVFCAGLIWRGSRATWQFAARWYHIFGTSYQAASLSFTPARLFGVLVLAGLVARGIAAEIPIGRQNLALGKTRYENTPQLQAARWITTHTDSNVVMASGLASLIHHYTGRRVIWFPPITNPRVLMDGIRKYHIQYVILIERGFNYYLPPETVCFSLLEKAYPQNFRLVENQGHVKIFEVLPDEPTGCEQTNEQSKSIPAGGKCGAASFLEATQPRRP